MMSLLPSAEAPLWLALFSSLLGLGGLAARARPLSEPKRWLLFGLIALLPLLCPSRGLGSTFFTGLSVVFAARLPDLERERQRKAAWELWLWLFLPMLRRFGRDSRTWRAQRARASRSVTGALKRGLAVASLALILWIVDGHSVPTWLRSTALILFFVGVITGLAMLVSGQLEWFGFEIDPVFDEPLESRSPREFWGRRWNRFIARFALRHIALRPALATASPLQRTWLVFFWSGVFHEYFAWGVAGTGGKPGTMLLFFLLQALVLSLPQSLRLNLGHRVGQVLTFAWMTLCAPLFFQSVYEPLVTLGYPSSWLPDWYFPPP